MNYDKRLCDVGKPRFIGKKLITNAMHFERTRVDRAIGVEIFMKIATRRAALNQLIATHFNNAMTVIDL